MVSSVDNDRLAPVQLVKQLNERYEKVPTRRSATHSHSAAYLHVYDVHHRFLQAHKAFEDNFWATKMNLKVLALELKANIQICPYKNAYGMQGCSSAALAQTKTDYDAFLGDAANLQAVRNALQDSKLPSELRKTLEIMQKTFLCYITEDPQATAMKVSQQLSTGLLFFAIIPNHLML